MWQRVTLSTQQLVLISVSSLGQNSGGRTEQIVGLTLARGPLPLCDRMATNRLPIRDATTGQSAPRSPCIPELFQYSRNNLTKTRKKPKTYGSVLGVIFLGGVRALQVPSHQRFARQ